MHVHLFSDQSFTGRIGSTAPPAHQHNSRARTWRTAGDYFIVIFAPNKIPPAISEHTPISLLSNTMTNDARMCYEWSSHHHGNPLMSADNWSEDADGIPCSYVDQFSPLFEKSWAHNLTFHRETYSTEPEVRSKLFFFF